MNLTEISSAIFNNVYDGLKAPQDFSLSLEQIKMEVGTYRNKLIEQYRGNKQGSKRLNRDHFLQTIDGIHVSIKDLSRNPVLPSFKKAYYFELPEIAYTFDNTAIEFIGPMDKSRNWKVYTNTTFRSHKYKPLTSLSPFVYIDTTPNASGLLDCFIFNAGEYASLKYLSTIAIFEHPEMVVSQMQGEDEAEYPAPGWMQDEIISHLTKRYIYFYRTLNIPEQTSDRSEDTPKVA
jgi:hypothetical protein